MKVNSYADGRLEDFRCSYESRSRLRIEFITSPEWGWLRASSNIRAFEARNIPNTQFGINFPSPKWDRVLTARIPIYPELKRVTCRITNEDDEVVAEVFANIHSGLDFTTQSVFLNHSLSFSHPLKSSLNYARS